MAVACSEGLIGHDVRMGVAKATRNRTADKVVQRLVGQARDAHVKQAHVDMLALAGTLRMHHRGKDGGGSVGAGQNIDTYRWRLFQTQKIFLKRCPRPANRTGALAGPAFLAEPDDQSRDAVQPAFSAISRPWIKQLEIMDTSS